MAVKNVIKNRKDEDNSLEKKIIYNETPIIRSG